MTKKIFALILALALVLSLSAAAFAISDEEGAAWAEANGYVKPAPDLAASATELGGGINYGAIAWPEELKVAAIKEYLKGGNAIADPAYAQDDSGYNYRNMMQMATCYNNVPNCSNLELVLNLEKVTLCGISEAGTSKVNEFLANPSVCVSWSRQILPAEEELGYNYYGSYGLSFYGEVKNYTVEDLETEAGQDGVIRVFDTYYNTGASFWAGYSKNFAAAADEAAVREGKLTYIRNLLASGTMVAYEIIPSRVVLTSPYLIDLVPQYLNALTYTGVQSGDDKYAYDLGVSDAFIDRLIAVKNDYMASEENVKAVEEYYSTGMFPMLDPMAQAFNMPTSLEVAKDLTNAGGLMTQVTWTPAE